MTQGKDNGPKTPINDFIAICRDDPAKVYVSMEAEQNARDDFNLGSKDELKKFIADGGLSSPKHINTELWDRNPLKDTVPSYVDAFSFSSGTKQGYIAYCPNPKVKNWLLKSFKLDLKGPGKSINTFAEAMLKATTTLIENPVKIEKKET